MMDALHEECTCTCDPVEQGGVIHHPYCETNHPNHPCNDRSCRFTPNEYEAEQ